MEDFSKRLAKALILRDVKASELAQKTNISKATISRYLSGQYKAKQDNIYTICKVLNINEAWLMGYDTNIDRVPDELRSENSNILTYKCVDNSNIPILGIGDIAYIYLQNYLISGQFFYVKLNGKNMIRQIYKDSTTTKFKPYNPNYKTLIYKNTDLDKMEFIIIGKVIKIENKSFFENHQIGD